MTVLSKKEILGKVVKKELPAPRCTLCGKPISLAKSDWEVVHRGDGVRCYICEECLRH